MDDERVKEYLTSFFQRGPQKNQEILPVVLKWEVLLQQIPGLRKKNPGRHCRLVDIVNNTVLLEADHPGWLQLVQLHEGEIVTSLQRNFPTLAVKRITFRLARQSEDLRLVSTQTGDPVKEKISEEEERQIENLLDQLGALVKKKD